MRIRKWQESRIDLESGGVLHIRAKFKMLRLTANDRVVMSAIADAVQRGDAHRLVKFATATSIEGPVPPASPSGAPEWLARAATEDK